MSFKRGLKYPAHIILTTMLAMVFIGGGCHTTPKSKTQKDSLTTKKSPVKKPSTAQQLYRAILGETKARGWQIETASEKHYLVNTKYEQINPRFRKRRLMRVLVFARGGALRINVKYERNKGTESEAQWIEVMDELTQKRAREEELLLGRAIERRFQKSRR